MPEFVCETCQQSFTVSPSALAKYPNWRPKSCMACRKPSAVRRPSREENLSTGSVLERYSDGPMSGVFTDGAADPNPGPGGWGAVYVVDGTIVAERHGHEPHTTNNRMELAALIAGCRMVPRDAKAIVYSDSELCVKSITLWARGWKARGWKRKDGPIKNVELVQELYELYHGHPGLTLQWIRAHAGNRWNEYADSLATAYRRDVR
ncbi:MAG: ribonuclease H [Vicinamibacterales bacterium]